jgi:hypothetical protein
VEDNTSDQEDFDSNDEELEESESGHDEGQDSDAGEAEQEDQPKNRFDAVRQAIDAFGRGEKVLLPGEGEEGDQEESDERQAKPAKAAGDAQDKSSTGKPAGDSSKPAKPSPYTIIDADGDEAELEWPDGAKIRFNADGRQREVKSLEELVSLAQKGVAFDRRSSEWGQMERQLRDERAQLEQQVKDAEELLLRALFDKEARQALRKELAPFRNPKVREALEAKEKLARREQADQQHAEQANRQVLQQFHEKVEEEARSLIQDFHYLDESDVPAITQTFYQNYEDLRQAAIEKFKREAPELGVSEQDAINAANRWALTYLTEENLREVAKAYDEHYASRANGRQVKGAASKGAKPQSRPTEDDEDEELDEDEAIARAERHNAERHNRKVKSKLRGAHSPRVLRSGGAAPGPSSGAIRISEGLTFAQRMEQMRRTLRSAAKPRR